ncbi:gamma-glutamyltranspeptidase [Galdieria sulphuraria]|uniref:Gamma-glutamyltranspeptidase n=1 Tax=Galdieria sulphuraria TaxID=130081 RepID=M2XDF8_GALSU|nr:gamma-glutamyltranspeptidase [Galdieria sulphuraria]EME28012.1 gamma-glutamyltranspeptidase [Galdieria sulphuraria]|eukprot:XP_005704532.1 gamma-glutamyltranspeptidase [Galdieria sulphuraria]
MYSSLPFHSRRSPVYSTQGICASSQPLASAAGAKILASGGNAADAAVAIAAALNVTEPCSTGVGGDCFVLFYSNQTKRVQALLGNGSTPEQLTLDRVLEAGYGPENPLPPTSVHTIPVPGAAAGWIDTVATFGSGNLTLREILDPAISLARDGFPVSPIAAYHWNNSIDLLKSAKGASSIFLCEGRAPKAGDIFKNPDLASTFEQLAKEGKDAFYNGGTIAHAIVETIQQLGGFMTRQDLAAHRSDFQEPIRTSYRDMYVWEVPPPTQGIAALIALNILEAYPSHWQHFHDAEHLHGLIESLRLSFAYVSRYVADPLHHKIPVAELLSKSFANQLANKISNRALSPKELGPMNLSFSDTVQFCAVDGNGNACSMINSNFVGFGTGIVPNGCGFTLHNRGLNFSLDKSHPNVLAPRKRPYHTIIPGLATMKNNGDLYAAFGVMGGFMQPQGHVQVLSNMVSSE